MTLNNASSVAASFGCKKKKSDTTLCSAKEESICCNFILLTPIREKGNGSWFMGHHNRNFDAVDLPFFFISYVIFVLVMVDIISHFTTMISLIKIRWLGMP